MYSLPWSKAMPTLLIFPVTRIHDYSQLGPDHKVALCVCSIIIWIQFFTSGSGAFKHNVSVTEQLGGDLDWNGEWCKNCDWDLQRWCDDETIVFFFFCTPGSPRKSQWVNERHGDRWWGFNEAGGDEGTRMTTAHLRHKRCLKIEGWWGVIEGVAIGGGMGG